MELAIIDKKLAMDSRDIAKLTKKRHADVLRDIRNMISKLDGAKMRSLTSADLGSLKGIELLEYKDNKGN